MTCIFLFITVVIGKILLDIEFFLVECKLSSLNVTKQDLHQMNFNKF